MPITCHQTRAKHASAETNPSNMIQKTRQASMPKYIERLFCPINIPILQRVTAESLDNIQHDFFGHDSTYEDKEAARREMQRIKYKIPSLGLTPLLALFFALLNIDINLKEYVMHIDTEANKRKNTRFFLDLHKGIATAFLNNKISLGTFVDMCEETYALA